MFNNIIYFLVVLMVFSISYAGDTPEDPLSYSLGMILITWFVFAVYCRWGFRRLLNQYLEDSETESRFAGDYQGLVMRLSILAIFLFSLDVYLFHLKFWLQSIPGFKYLTVLQGLLAVGLFVLYQCTIWYFSYPAYLEAFGTDVRRRPFILSSIKLNVPVLFPWFILTLAYDLLGLSPWNWPGLILNKPVGQILFFAIFLVVLMIFMPSFVQYWWGCRPLRPSDKVNALKAFLYEKGFRYRNLVDWPIFEGRMLTAGIMGIVPKYRYLLITDSLMKILSIEELKAVVAHEMGHARHRHMLFYTVFFLAFMVVSFGLFDLFGYFLATLPFFMKGFAEADSNTITLYYLTLSLPVLLSLLVYFRFIMGFFMRHFERQADLYSAVLMESPLETIRSLEKIALLSGKIRELPSWHHFSIKQRVDCLWRMMKKPGLVKRHNRFLTVWLTIYLAGMIVMGYSANFGSAKEQLTQHVAIKRLKQMIEKQPQDVDLHIHLAMLYHEVEKHREAIDEYERAMLLDPERAEVVNNLAWLLVTSPDEGLRDRERGLMLAKAAVALERSSTFLDTLAEAYFVNGLVEEAIMTGKEALSLAKEKKGYYRRQLERFMGTTEKGHS